MERYSAKSIDDLRRMVLPLEIRQKMGLEADVSYVTLQCIGKIVIMQLVKQLANDDNSETEHFSSKVDKLGRIEVPLELMKEVGWKIRDEIALYYVDDGMVILKVA